MTGWRSPLALQLEAEGLRYIEPDEPTGDAELRAAWQLVPDDIKRQTLATVRAEADEQFARDTLARWNTGDWEREMTTITTTTTQGTIGALKWKTTELAFAYDPQLVEHLKAKIPAEFREWDPGKKVWRIRGIYYVDSFLRWARQAGHDVLEELHA